MNPIKKTGQIVGAFLFINLILGMLNNLLLLGPLMVAKDFLTNFAPNSVPINQSILLSLLNGMFPILIAIMMYPLFKRYGKSAALGYVALTVIRFALMAIDKTAVFALLSVSHEFVNAAPSDASHYQTLGNVLYGLRSWTHHVDILFSFVSFFFFFYLLLRTKLAPLFFTVFGLLSSMAGISEMLLNIFGHHHPWHMLMLFPTALSVLSLAVWLLVKGFKGDVESGHA